MNKFSASSALSLSPACNGRIRVTLPSLLAAALLLVLATSAPGYAQDATAASSQTPPAKMIHVLRRATSLPDQSVDREQLKLRTMERPDLTPVNTGQGIVYVCDPGVATSTCNYLNTTVAGAYNGTFTNANATIYIMYGTTGLAQSLSAGGIVTYTQYVSALNAIEIKSPILTTALSSLSTYDAMPYGSGSVYINNPLAAAFGLESTANGFAGFDKNGNSCTLGSTGCYDSVITVTNDAGTPLYYDDLGGPEPMDAYDFYSTIEHETDEVLGTSSCISDPGSPGSLNDTYCDFYGIPTAAGTPSAVDLYRYSAPGALILDSSLSTTPGAYFSYDGGAHNDTIGVGGQPKYYNTLNQGDDYADYVSSTPDCGTNQAVQDGEGCPGEDQGLSILNDGGSEITILTAVGFSVPAPAAMLSASSILFPSTSVDTWSNSQQVTLSNTGTAPLSITSIVLSGANAGQFVFANNCGTSLAVGANCTIHGHFQPTTFGSAGASVVITDNASGSPQSISLSGKAAADTLPLTFSYSALNYGTTTVNTTSGSEGVTVTNTGNSTVTFSSIAITGTNASEFVFANSCGTSLAAGANCTIHGHFAPTASGPAVAAITITDSASNSPQSISLKGTGN